MPAQAPLLPTYPAVPVIPGVRVLNLADLQWNQLLEITPAGSLPGVTTLSTLLAFFQTGAPLNVPVRMEDGGQALTMTADDYLLIIDTTVAGNTTVKLPADPSDGDTAAVKVTSGISIGVHTVTISGAAGELINGAATLVMEAVWMVVRVTFFDGVWYTT